MTLRYLPALLFLVLFAACSAPPKPVALETSSGFGELWEGFVDIAERTGYHLDSAESDRGKRIFVSRWLERPAPFGVGNRTRLHGKFTRAATESSGWRLEFWVERQVVKDISRGFDARERDWSAGGQDNTREEIMLSQLRMRFGQPLDLPPPQRSDR